MTKALQAPRVRVITKRELMLRQLFSEMDLNGDGTVSQTEMIKALRRRKPILAILSDALDYGKPDSAHADFKAATVAMFSEMDSDGSKTITWEELHSFFRKRVPPPDTVTVTVHLLERLPKPLAGAVMRVEVRASNGAEARTRAVKATRAGEVYFGTTTKEVGTGAAGGGSVLRLAGVTDPNDKIVISIFHEEGGRQVGLSTTLNHC
jgi:hypothetical protein